MSARTLGELETINLKISDLEQQISNLELKLIGLPDRKNKEQNKMEYQYEFDLYSYKKDLRAQQSLLAKVIKD